VISSITDLVTDAIELLNFVVNVCIKLGGNHTDLAFVGPGDKLIRFCHNKTYFNELHRPPGRSRQGAIHPSEWTFVRCWLKYVPVMAYRMFTCA
jgi:hypothetical protein